MKPRNSRSTAAALALFSFFPNISAATFAQKSLPCSISSFEDAISLPGVTVTVVKADHVLENGTYGDKTNLDLPEKPVSEFQVGLYLPVRWNQRTLTVGSGSFSGGINWVGMSEGPHYGFATITTDMGHNSNGSNVYWANEKTLYDWGYRATHGAVVVGKLLSRHYYLDRAIPYSYYAGCSTGGRQGLREIQYDADSFDGALVGAPAWDTVGLMPWIAHIAHEQLAGDATDMLGAQQFPLVAAEVLRQCDAVDGVVDGIVSDPWSCNFDISRIVCADPTRCLTEGQARTAQRMWADYVVDGELVSHGFGLTSEDQWSVYFPDNATMAGWDFDFLRAMVYNTTNYTFRNFTDAAVGTDTRRVNPGRATADDFDIRAFRDRPQGGGKILMYHGLADGVITPKASRQYYTSTQTATHSDLPGLRDWFRYFEVPGMQHCYFTGRYGAPWAFGAFAQAAQLRMLPFLRNGSLPAGEGWSVPGHLGDPAYDAYAALVRWVEEDKAPEQIVATAFNEDWSVNRTRPICPYPERPVYGKGKVDDAASWSCR